MPVSKFRLPAGTKYMVHQTGRGKKIRDSYRKEDDGQEKEAGIAGTVGTALKTGVKGMGRAMASSGKAVGSAASRAGRGVSSRVNLGMRRMKAPPAPKAHLGKTIRNFGGAGAAIGGVRGYQNAAPGQGMQGAMQGAGRGAMIGAGAGLTGRHFLNKRMKMQHMKDYNLMKAAMTLQEAKDSVGRTEKRAAEKKPRIDRFGLTARQRNKAIRNARGESNNLKSTAKKVGVLGAAGAAGIGAGMLSTGLLNRLGVRGATPVGMAARMAIPAAVGIGAGEGVLVPALMHSQASTRKKEREAIQAKREQLGIKGPMAADDRTGWDKSTKAQKASLFSAVPVGMGAGLGSSVLALHSLMGDKVPPRLAAELASWAGLGTGMLVGGKLLNHATSHIRTPKPRPTKKARLSGKKSSGSTDDSGYA